MKEREHDTHPCFLFCALPRKRLAFVFEGRFGWVFSPSWGGFHSDFEHTFAAEAQAFEN
jgi:hypothetical protein